MKTVISEGNSLYVSFTVYSNFFGWKDGVYSSTSGKKSGGHAVAGIGYGTEVGSCRTPGGQGAAVSTATSSSSVVPISLGLKKARLT